VAARFCQGLAAAGYWTAAMVWLLDTVPSGSRGRTIGMVFGVSEAGAVAGPAVGGLAASVGRGPMFAAIAACAILLAGATMRFPRPARPVVASLHVTRMFANGGVRTAMLAALLPAVVLAAMMVLGPLEQHRLGAGAAEIAITFGLAAAVGIVARPIFGRWSDRVGTMRPVQVSLLVGAPVLVLTGLADSRLTAAVLIVVTLVVTGIMWAPLMVMMADACALAGAGQLSAVLAMDLIWPPGNTLGAAGAGAIAQAAGQRVAYVAVAALLLAGFLVLARARPPVQPPVVATSP
jgi:predicted MFS family arabinose efflux permease